MQLVNNEEKMKKKKKNVGEEKNYKKNCQKCQVCANKKIPPFRMPV